MSQKIRNYLLFVFVFGFIFVTIVVSLYASGYKFNLSWPLKLNRLLQKTGMLIIESEPDKALIYLNDKIQKDSSLKPWKKDWLLTPAKIKNILPGEYELRLEQEGYWPFKQKIYINSGETTFVKGVNLFLDNSPLMIQLAKEGELKLSPDNKYLYLAGEEKIITLKTELGRSLEVLTTPGAWTSDNQLFSEGVLFDPQKAESDINYSKIVGPGAISWRLDSRNGSLYYQTTGTINRLEENGKTTTIINDSKNYLDFEPRGDKLFAITSSSRQVRLELASQKDTKQADFWTLPNSGEYAFARDLKNQLAVYDRQNNTLYLFNESIIKAGPIVIRNIKHWSELTSDSLIYTNGFEIFIFNLNSGRHDLVTRRSQEITKIIWQATGNYLVFSEIDTLNVLDFKNLNTTQLFKATKLSSPVIDEKTGSLYFWAKIGDSEGVYKLLLQ